MTRVLIVESDAAQVRSLSRAFAKARPDIAIETARGWDTATRLLREQRVDLLLLGLRSAESDQLELLEWVHEHSPETEVFTMAEPGALAPGDQRLNGAAGQHFEKPLVVADVVTRLCDALNQSVRGHLDNVSLASLLQLLEMERKSCSLHVTCGELQGSLVVSKGVLICAKTEDLRGEAAAIAIVAWPGASVAFSRRDAESAVEIHSSLGFILIEAMRRVDEAARHLGRGEGAGSAWPLPRRAYGATPNGRPGVTFDSSRPPGELGLPSGASGLAVVETSTGNVLRSASREGCPIGELAQLASQLLLQEAATLRLCGEEEDVEELVLSTTTRCDVIRPLSQTEFALLVFAPEDTNLVIARLELDHFIAVEQATRGS
jgi:ActR/RegA family two-component response regulator